ncbi:MAG: MBOAT family protein [Pirellulales bacterium]|nr:MBOAT family protein [Pirellulales bacterium]
MVFSSPLFLFAFLPLVLTVYFLAPRKLRNLVLLLASLLFYAWGEPAFVLVMLASIAWNYIAGLAVHLTRKTAASKTVLAIAIAVNLGVLAYYKYAGFLLDQLNWALTGLGVHGVRYHSILLPLGISFFTFQSISYLIDVFRGEANVQRNPINLALYIALFPQLIAGPIVRYHDVAVQIVKRTVTRAGFADGIRRFIWGLGKKVLLANTVGVVADAIFALPTNELSATVAWLGVICYSLQIYFDFSGYSDMAIGLGRMFGFRFQENFNYPYIAVSVTDFWRRWHISLSSWFRDYLYIPLGGNRVSVKRLYANLLTVFLLCGLWHGASWTFVLWGVFHGALLVGERLGLRRFTARLGPGQHLYLLLVVMLGWVLFRAETLTEASSYYAAMFGAGNAVGKYPLAMFVSPGLIAAMIAGGIAATPTLPWVRSYWQHNPNGPSSDPTLAQWSWRQAGWLAGSVVIPLVVFAGSVIVLSASTYNPFIYFRF